MILNPISNEDTNQHMDKWICNIRISVRGKKIQKCIRRLMKDILIANGSNKRISFVKYCIHNFDIQLDTKDY